eukprot:gene23487-28437_t
MGKGSFSSGDIENPADLNPNFEVKPLVDGVALSTAMEFSSVGVDSTEMFSLVSLKAPELTLQDRAPLYLSCVADKSGSMAGEKLKNMKKTLQFVCRQLQTNDKFGLVTYDEYVTEDIPLCAVDQDDCNLKVEAISAGSTTNLSGGLLKGLEQHGRREGLLGNLAHAFGTVCGGSSSPGSGAVRAVVLFTDGMANKGITDSAALVKRVDRVVKQLPEQCSVFTFGFGSDHNELLLSSLSEVGSGRYFFIENESKMAESFAGALGGLLSVAAQNVSVKIRATEGAVISKVHTKYVTEQLSDGSYKISLGDLYSEENRDIVLELQLPKHTVNPNKQPDSLTTSSIRPFEVEISYFDVPLDTRVKRKAESAISVTRQAAGHSQERQECNVAVRQHRQRMKAAQAMEEAMEYADRGDFETSAGVLLTRCRSLELEGDDVQDLSRELKDDILDSINTLQSGHEYKR